MDNVPGNRYVSRNKNAEGTLVMASTVARMSKKELTEIISSTVERKLLEILGDPDEGLTLKKTLRRRLLAAQCCEARLCRQRHERRHHSGQGRQIDPRRRRRS